jgi:NAD(P) transhydrogenase subunit alpha
MTTEPLPEASEAPAPAASVAAGSGRGPLVVGVLRELESGERRVAVVPDGVGRLGRLGLAVVVEAGAGEGAWLVDELYVAAGASVLDRDEVLARSDVLVMTGGPAPALLAGLRSGQVVVGMLRPLTEPALARSLAERGVTAVSLDGLPRTLSRAQSMDALSSQANIAGYKAALVAAAAFGRVFPMMITAAGTAKPARVLVLGAGVAGLAAMTTARRLGAVVTGYDVRPEAAEEIRSVGASVLELSPVAGGSAEGGYARALNDEEQDAQRRELDGLIARYDVVITTAQVPGRRPPLLIGEEALERMRPGTVVVDMASGPLGGNVAGSEERATVVTEHGVTIIGAGDLAASVATAASSAFSHNLVALLGQLVADGSLAVDLDDEIQAGVVITHAGRVVHPATAAALDAVSIDAGLSSAGAESAGAAQ